MAGNLEKLAMAQALYCELGKIVKTGDPDNLRGRADAELREDYESKGTDRYRIKVNGTEVGTLSARFTKQTVRLYVEDEDEFCKWLIEDGLGYLMSFIRTQKGQALVDYMASAIVADGEVPAGCRAYEEPARWAGTVIKGCDLGKVSEASGVALPEAVMGFLGSVEVG